MQLCEKAFYKDLQLHSAEVSSFQKERQKRKLRKILVMDGFGLSVVGCAAARASWLAGGRFRNPTNPFIDDVIDELVVAAYRRSTSNLRTAQILSTMKFATLLLSSSILSTHAFVTPPPVVRTPRALMAQPAVVGRASMVDRVLSTTSKTSALKANVPYNSSDRKIVQWMTLLRVVLPSLAAGIGAFYAFPALSIYITSLMTGADAAGVLTVLSTDSSQFVQNFLSVSSLLFSILVGQTYVRSLVKHSCDHLLSQLSL